MSFLNFKDVCKNYGSGNNVTEVLHNINLDIEEGEFVAIVGFSGSGKTTLMSSIAGLIKPDSGEIIFKGQPITGPSPERGIVFQSYSLMPWLTVYGNIELAVNEVFGDWPKKKREEHMAGRIRTLSKDYKRILVIMELQRKDGVIEKVLEGGKGK